MTIGPWDLYDASGRVRRNIGAAEARDLVIINADPAVWIKNHDTAEEIHWSDVCAEPWPSDEAGYPYGTPPEDWPYGNGC